jgi:uncharacterized protein YbbC (DUF1343 family)
MAVSPGIEQLMSSGLGRLARRRIGLLTNQAGVLPDLRHDLDALLEAEVGVVACFGPEHGFRGSAQAGFSEPTTTDPSTGLPLYDTYGGGSSRFAEQLRSAGVEVLLADLQGVGVRFYTVVSTLYDAIEAAEGAGVEVLVLDRPNPLGGTCVEGPVLGPAFASFVGRAPIPLRHGMTPGELALLFADRLGSSGVEVVRMAGWHRSMCFAATGLSWVPPSPNMPTPATATCYPGTCLLEGSNLSVGRGTTTPFEVFGAPWVDGRLAAHLRDCELAGVKVREAHFVPTFSTYSGQEVHGAQFHVVDPCAFDPIRAGLEVLAIAGRVWPDHLELDPAHFDRLCGTDSIRSALNQGLEVEAICRSWQEDLAAFRPRRQACLLYEDPASS